MAQANLKSDTSDFTNELKQTQDNIKNLVRENDELKAHCNELLDFVERVNFAYQFQHGATTENVFGITAKLLINKIPKQSLAEIEARAIEKCEQNCTHYEPKLNGNMEAGVSGGNWVSRHELISIAKELHKG